MTVVQAYQQLAAALATVYGSGEAQSVARIVFEDAFHIRNLKRRDQLTPHQLSKLSRIQSRLLNHEPVQYVMGRCHFFGMVFKVDRRGLIPRQETEELVQWVFETLDEATAPVKRVLDIGTGSGCIPVTIKVKKPELNVTAWDVSSEALALAKENAITNRADISLEKVDILDRKSWPNLPGFDLIVSNPPYIPPSEAHLVPENVKNFEPRLALFSESGATAFYEAIADFAREYLSGAGWLFFEVNEFHAHRILQILEEKGFADCRLRKDINGKDRMLRARWEGR